MSTITTAADLVLSTPAVTWYRWWLLLSCDCRHARTIRVATASPNTEALMRDVVGRLRCRVCRAKPHGVALRNGSATTAGWQDEVVLLGVAREW